MSRVTIHAIDEIVSGPDVLLADHLVSTRLEAGLSRHLLACETGLTSADIDLLETGRLGAFASPDQARLAMLAYCDALGLDPGPALGRLEPYAARQLLLPPAAPVRRTGVMQTLGTLVFAALVAWQAATVFADAGAGRSGQSPASMSALPQ